MSPAKVAVACGLLALLLSACGIKSKPVAGTAHLQEKQHAFYGLVDDPRSTHAGCLRRSKLPIREYLTGDQRLPAIQVGAPQQGPTIVFYPTPGAAQALQISGRDEGAEAIGSALLFPNGASDSELSIVEGCTVAGVGG